MDVWRWKNRKDGEMDMQVSHNNDSHLEEDGAAVVVSQVSKSMAFTDRQTGLHTVRILLPEK